MGDHYIGSYVMLPDGSVRQAPEILSHPNQQIAFDCLYDTVVHTAFLGYNRFPDCDPPHCFETMVFGGLMDSETETYTSLAAAKRGHEGWVEKVRGTLGFA